MLQYKLVKCYTGGDARRPQQSFILRQRHFYSGTLSATLTYDVMILLFSRLKLERKSTAAAIEKSYVLSAARGNAVYFRIE